MDATPLRKGAGAAKGAGNGDWRIAGVLRNRDATLVIHHAGAAQYFEKIFLHDWDNLARQQVETHFSED